MSGILKISEAATLALHAGAYLASNSEGPAPTRRIASELNVSEAHLAKVLQRLSKEGLVRSTPGPKGGFNLAKPADEISLLEVYEAIEGPLGVGGCLLGEPVCKDGLCILGGLVTEVDQRVRDYLARTRLSQLTGAIPAL